jgi:nicotinamidase-related amidase
MSDTKSQGLILVDIQNDYFAGGSMELVGMEEAATQASAILKQFREQQLPVFHIQHFSVRPGSTFFVPDTEGVEINNLVSPQENEPVVRKNYPNSFRETDLLGNIQDAGVTNLVIVGAMSHMCIDATTRAAFDYGFTCTVISDACATRDLEFAGKRIPASDVHGSFMAALSAPYASVLNGTEFVLS